jgi:hypothetical protein
MSNNRNISSVNILKIFDQKEKKKYRLFNKKKISMSPFNFNHWLEHRFLS